MNILMYPITEDGTVILIKEPIRKICFITANFEALQLTVWHLAKWGIKSTTMIASTMIKYEEVSV